MTRDQSYYFVLCKRGARLLTDEPKPGSRVLHEEGTPWVGDSLDDIYGMIPIVNTIINGRELKEMGGFAFLEYSPSR